MSPTPGKTPSAIVLTRVCAHMSPAACVMKPYANARICCLSARAVRVVLGVPGCGQDVVEPLTGLFGVDLGLAEGEVGEPVGADHTGAVRRGLGLRAATISARTG